ncbi:MAG: enoyl-CoA hydratase-related protein [Solirubrobacterales bacterium]
MSDWETIEVIVDDGVAWVRFDRVERRNTVNAQMVDEVHAALLGLAEREDVAVVVLTGNGPTFSPGADLDRDPEAPPQVPANESYHSAATLVEMPQVTIAAINGGCAGAAFAWAAACDLRIASAKARFAIGFLDVGVSGELGLGWTLTRMLGSAKARELYLMPGKFDAAAALAMGLVSAVHEPEDFDAAARALAADLASRDRGALRDIKANLVDAGRLPLGEYVDAEAERHLSRFTGAAGQDTMRRFAARNRSLGSK